MAIYVIISAILFVLAVSNSAAEPVNVVRLQGYITDGAAEKVVNQLRSGGTLYVDSPGGLSRPAERIARHLRANRISLVVDGWCLSACATFIYTAAPSIRLTERAFVAGFKSATGVYGLMDRSMPPKEAQLYDKLVAEEGAFFNELKISEEFFLMAAREMLPVCVRGRSVEEPFEIGYRALIVVLDPEVLRWGGVRVAEGLIRSEEEMKSRLLLNGVRGDTWKFRYVSNSELLNERSPLPLPDCRGQK